MQTQSFFTYLHQSPTPYHAAANSQSLLLNAGFTLLSPDTGTWQLSLGGRYVLDCEDGTTVAFVLPLRVPKAFHIVATHNDSPALRLKPSPVVQREGCLLLGAEVYGGPLLGTWFDRPLTIAGRVFTRGDDWRHPHSHLVRLSETVTIPSLAIHMKRDPGDINPQKELLALWGLADGPSFEAQLAAAVHRDPDAILGTELYLVSAEAPAIVGASGTLYAASRIDNLANAYAGTRAIRDAQPLDAIALFVSFQHEEIGSHSLGGAASSHFLQLLSAIADALDLSLNVLLPHSLLLSADQAHAAHPNYADKADPMHRPRLGAGPVLKIAANHSYATTPRGEAILSALCAAEGIPFQRFVNRSDMRGGSTIGPLAETATGIEAIDVGSAMLAMHSIREMAHLGDQAEMARLMHSFLSA